MRQNPTRNTKSFVDRVSELLKLEGQHGSITLSCRHRDILNCSKTRHFNSCFRPRGMYEEQPWIYCQYRPEICIIFKRDRSGQFLARCFGFYSRNEQALKLGKIYGNGMTYEEIKYELSRVDNNMIVEGTHGDNYFTSHGLLQ